MDTLIYDIALTFLPGIGDINAKKIFSRFGNSKEVFDTKIHELEAIPGVGQVTAQKIFTKLDSALKLAEEELKYVYANDIKVITYSDKNYPSRLKDCVDAPFVLYFMGNPNFEKQKIISIVGTRNPSNYGTTFCEKFIEEISVKHPEIVIVSGLAFGIDITAHKAALKNNLETWAVFGHGLSYIYPAQHKKFVHTLLDKGGTIMCDFPHLTQPDAPNFPQRNRIVAGLSDAICVIESGLKGGSMITATIGNSYNRDVFALPGNVTSKHSSGCNSLIKSNRANLLESVDDLDYIMNWTDGNNTLKNKSVINLDSFNENDRKIIEILLRNKTIEIDDLTRQTGLNPNVLGLSLIELELKNIIKSIPGKMFTLI